MEEQRKSSYLSLNESPLPFIILTSILGGSLAASVAVANKIVDIFGFTPSATVIAYSITFICTDCISELYGKKRANQAVLAGFIAFALATLLYIVAIYIPSADFWEGQEAFVTIFGTSWRVALGGIIAYLCSQFHDVWAFHFWRDKTKTKHLWLRNNLSTMTSQAIDTVIFITIAFYGVFPILPVIIGQYVVKLGIALVDTPIVYALVGVINKKRDKIATT